MDTAIDHGQKSIASAASATATSTLNSSEWQESYKPLPFLYSGLFMVWIALVGIWTLNTWTKRHWQTSNLQWLLTVVPVLKALVLGLSLIFWYSCLNLSTCSFWVAFGVFVTRIFFETACFVAFLLISHGYCIMYEQLSISERRSIAGLSSLLYLALTGYKAAVPQFAVLMVAIYFVILYVIFLHVSNNLNTLREQLQYIQEERFQLMHSAVHIKYSMFKKFQGAMLLIVVAEILMHTRAEGAANEYWIRLLIRECVEIGIFFYIGWTFRSREVTPFFTVIPTLHSPNHRTLPPIYSIEMNQREFNNLDFKDWHIGVPTSMPKEDDDHKAMLVIVCNPRLSSHEDTAKTAHKICMSPVVRRSFNVPSCKQGAFKAKFDVVSNKHMDLTPSSQCIIARFLKQGLSKSTHSGEQGKYYSCWTGETEGNVPNGDHNKLPSILDDNVKQDGSCYSLWNGHLELEPVLSRLV